MNMKKVLCGVLATSMALSFASVSAFAAAGSLSMEKSATGIIRDKDAVTSLGVMNSDGEEIQVAEKFSASKSQGEIQLDGINPGQTFYIFLGKNNGSDLGTDFSDDNGTWNAAHGSTKIDYADLGDSDLFSMKVEKDGNGKSLIKSVELVGDKTIDNSGRGTWLKVTLNDSPTTSEMKAIADLTFKMKSKDAKYTTAKKDDFESGYESTVKLTMWINNTKKTGTEAEADEGDRVYFDPSKNDTNTFIWGDDRAALKFDADSDTKEFYCRLSTKTDSELYSSYGDPVNAELYFYDFVTNASIPSTSRAVLTLGIPWDEDDEYQPDPESVFIYRKDADGSLIDVTDEFKYSEDDQEIPGWSFQTRVLGTYVVSDTELDVGAINAGNEDVMTPDSEPEVAPAPETPDTGKNIPNTGSSDMVNVAVAAAIVSLAAAGAVAFKKASK